MRILRLLVLGMVSLTMLSGCSYFKDRAWDFVDMGGGKISAGPQFLINARASKVLQAGAGFAQHEGVSMRGRRFSTSPTDRLACRSPRARR